MVSEKTSAIIRLLKRGILVEEEGSDLSIQILPDSPKVYSKSYLFSMT
jgi:hypothetical protein